MKSIFKSNLFGLGVLTGLSFILIYVTNRFILSVSFYNYSGVMFSGAPGQDTTIYDAIQKWIYISGFIYTLIKINLIALILYTALYLKDTDVSYKKVLNVVIYCEYIFLLPAAIKIFWFHYKYPNGTVLEWHKTYVLSVLALFNDVSADWYYPLQTLNVFEIAYWFLLGYGISKATHDDFDSSMRTVAVSYIPLLLIWVAVVSFCSLIMFPSLG